MELYKETGTNPFASCLPILLQTPIFFALFRVLNEYVVNGSRDRAADRGAGPPGGQLDDLRRAAVVDVPQQRTASTVKIVTVVLIVADVGLARSSPRAS